MIMKTRLSRHIACKAVKSFKQATHIKPDMQKHYNLGLIYLTHGVKEAAMGECRILKKLDGHNAERLFIIIQKRLCGLLTEALFVENPDYVTVYDSYFSWAGSRLHLILLLCAKTKILKTLSRNEHLIFWVHNGVIP